MAELAVGGWQLAGAKRPRVAVHKFSSCDGCQLAILCLEEELLEIAERVEIAWFLEASSDARPGPWDISFVEGSIGTAHDVERIKEVRSQSKTLITLGACATAGGIQALRNWWGGAESAEGRGRRAEGQGPRAEGRGPSEGAAANRQPPTANWPGLLPTSTPVSDHVKVDLELPGCPVNKLQVLEVVASTLIGRRPDLPEHAVCVDCKRRGLPCVMVAQDIPCLGPVTRSGCGAICPGFDRGCYGCFGPCASSKPEVLGANLRVRRQSPEAVVRLLRGFTAWSPPFREASDKVEGRR